LSAGMSGLVLSTMRHARRMIVAVIGFTVLILGLAMIVLPGPALIVIPTGLAILATEFLWARNLLKMVRDKLQKNSKGGKADETK
jgi:tellurite resistance protein TerC